MAPESAIASSRINVATDISEGAIPGIPQQGTSVRSTPYKIKSASEQVAQGLRAYIADHDLRVGSLLPSEFALSEMFSVSRMTLRKGMKRLAMEGIVASRPGVGHVVLSAHPLRKYALLFGLDPLSPRSSSFHQKLAYWLRRHFTQEETEPVFVVLDREDRSKAKLSDIRRRFRSGEFAGALLIHWSRHIAPLEREIVESQIPFLSVSLHGTNPNHLVLGHWALVRAAYEWLGPNERFPATVICARSSPGEAELERLPGLDILFYDEPPDVFHLTQAALTADPVPKAIIVPDDVAQVHAQAAILSESPTSPPLLAHLAIKGDTYPAGIPRLLLEVNPQDVATFCLEWLRGFSTTSPRGVIPIHPHLREQV